MSWQQILSGQAQHWTYFALGFMSATALFMTLATGIAVGILVSKRKDK